MHFSALFTEEYQEFFSQFCALSPPKASLLMFTSCVLLCNVPGFLLY